jgi:hypothetical protein
VGTDKVSEERSEQHRLGRKVEYNDCSSSFLIAPKKRVRKLVSLTAPTEYVVHCITRTGDDEAVDDKSHLIKYMRVERCKM